MRPASRPQAFRVSNTEQLEAVLWPTNASGLVIFLVSVGLSCALLSVVVETVWGHWQIRHWAVHAGQLEDVSVKDKRVTLRYRYVVDGVTHRGHKMDPEERLRVDVSPRDIQALQAAWKSGQAIEVRVHPGDAARATYLLTPQDLYLVIFIAVCPLAMIGMYAYLIWVKLRRWQQAQAFYR